MRSALIHFLTPPIFPADREKSLRVANLYMVLRVNMIGYLVALPLFLHRWGGWGALLFGFSCTYTLSMMAFARKGQYYSVGWAIILEIWLLLMYNATYTGGVEALSFAAGGFITLLATAFLLNWPETLAMTGVTLSYGGFLTALELHNRLLSPVNTAASPYIYLAAQSLYLLASMGLLFVATKSIRTLIDEQQAELTERHKATLALQQSEQRYRMLVENLPNSSTILFDHELRFVLVDGPEVERAGNTKAGLEGKTLFEALPPEFAQLAEPNMRAVLAGNQFTAELPYGDQIHFYSYVPLRDASGAIVLGLILAQNITERKQLESELQRYTQQLEQMVEARTADLRTAKDQIEVIIENTRDAIALVQANGDVQLVNPAFRSMFTARATEAIEGILTSVPEVPALEAVARGLVGAIVEREQQSLATRIQTPDGLAYDVDLAMVPVNRDQDDPPGMVLSAHDITQHKELERLKEQFVADAVHDLSTPITALAMRVHLLKVAPDQLEKHVLSLEGQVQHLSNLLDDLRTLSRLDRGVMTLELGQVDLNPIVQRVFDTYEPVALSRQQTLRLKLDPTLPQATCDARQMERVLVNLVSNAISYTRADKNITISTLQRQHQLIIEIADEGIGMSEKDRLHIFERFYRSDQARVERASGTGLGLAIVKEIIDLHGATITVESSLGVGTTFTISLSL